MNMPVPPQLRSTDTTRILVSQRVNPALLSGGQTSRIVPLSSALRQFGARIVDEIPSPGLAVAQAGDPDTVIVAEVDPLLERRIIAESPPQIFVERSQRVNYGFVGARPSIVDPGLVPLSSGGFETELVIVARDGTPIPGAEVLAFGAIWTHRGVTDANGRCLLQVAGDSPQTITSVLVRPRKNFWTRYVAGPVLEPGGSASIALLGVAESAGRPIDRAGWGLSAMNLTAVPREITGRGVRVAVIDSGLSADHPDIANIRDGVDVVGGTLDGAFTDFVSHGTHVSGTIGAEINLRGIRSVAPEAEIIPIKIFPGGGTEDLVAAINRAVELRADVINLSLGMAGGSEAVTQAINRARMAGAAPIAAAGNSAGPVLFPARLPGVLAVTAIGRDNTFPPDSYHAEQRATLPDGTVIPSDADGLFFAAFSCFGPEVDVCGPGVAVVSTVPDSGYLAMDGTSMACPHIAGLAALVLSAVPEFRTGSLAARNAARVDALFERIKSSCRPLTEVGDPTRIGAGLPDAQRALRF